jgi:hypothetical protein
MAFQKPFTLLFEPGLLDAFQKEIERLLNVHFSSEDYGFTEAHKMWKDVNGVHLNLQRRRYYKLGTNINGVPAYICIGTLSEGGEYIAVHLKSDGTVRRLDNLASENVEHPFVEPSITISREMYQGMQMIQPIDERAKQLICRVEKEYDREYINLYFNDSKALSAFVEEFPWAVKT